MKELTTKKFPTKERKEKHLKEKKHFERAQLWYYDNYVELIAQQREEHYLAAMK